MGAGYGMFSRSGGAFENDQNIEGNTVGFHSRVGCLGWSGLLPAAGGEFARRPVNTTFQQT